MDAHRLVTDVDGVELDIGASSISLSARRDLADVGSGRFDRPTVRVRLDLDLSDDSEFLGFAVTQFAMPVISRRGAPFDFRPAANLRSPAVVLPLIVRDRGRSLLMAPLSNPHEQVLTVVDGIVHWGWHGDLDEVPAGFRTHLGIYEGSSIATMLASWGDHLRTASGIERPDRSSNAITSRLSYWTDNGAAYWYRTEPGQTIGDSVVAVVDALLTDGVPIGAVELDSWFYRHETPRAIEAFGYPEEVPPSGMTAWRPRPDAFPEPADGAAVDVDVGDDQLEHLSRRLGGLPLTLHARHVSPRSPYIDETWWVDRHAAQPADPEFFRRWFDDAVRWGAGCIEQDWMLLFWFGTREMRRVPGRALEWQRALDRHATATGVDLLWCMATPADLIAAVGLPRVIAVRTSDDYRFADDPALLWTWFLTVNRLVAPLGLWPFKDCFFSNPRPDDGDPISGDPNAELEALLSAMSGGPVGIGDRIGRTDRDIVMRTCDDAGRLLQPDTPIGMVDDCLFGAPARGERLAWATSSVTLGDLTWTYVIAINTASTPIVLEDSLVLATVGIDDERHVYEWRTHLASTADRLTTRLDTRDWAFWVVCPHGSDDIGDPSKYVTKYSTKSSTKYST